MTDKDRGELPGGENEETCIAEAPLTVSLLATNQEKKLGKTSARLPSAPEKEKTFGECKKKQGGRAGREKTRLASARPGRVPETNQDTSAERGSLFFWPSLDSGQGPGKPEGLGDRSRTKMPDRQGFCAPW